MTTKEKVKKFYEDHKKGIQTAATIAVGAIVVAVIGKQIKKSFGTVSYTPRPVDIPIPNKRPLEVPPELVKKGFYAEACGTDWIDMISEADVNLTIDDLHEAVEDLKKIEGFDENSSVQAMFNVYVG